MSHHQILVPKWIIRSNFYLRRSKKQIFDENEGWPIIGSLWKNDKKIFHLPEVTYFSYASYAKSFGIRNLIFNAKIFLQFYLR